MASTFLNLNRRFPTPAAFADWLHQQPGPDWPVDGVVYHNTYIPNEAQWRGHESMRSMQTTYIGKGWDRGPHIYLASDAVRPEHRGVFVMTHPRYPGIHAGGCNSHAYGVETVADWDKNPPTETQKAWLVEIGAILTDYSRRVLTVSAHRDCMPGRTCPGRYGYAMKPEIQHRLEMMLHTTVLMPDRPPGSLTPYDEHSPILGAPRATMKQCADYILGAPTGEYDEYDVIMVILPAYWTISQRAGVDPVLAVAQMCHETGEPSDAPTRARALWSYWSQRPRRNPAGIGVTGTPGAGVSFASWAPEPQHPERVSGIEAHIGRLLAYAVLPAHQTAAQAELVRRALSVRSLPSRYWGCSPTLSGLRGTWAVPGTTYPQKLADVANAIRST